ncbi:MAG: hypothetical protein ABL930_00815 [Pseudobdellovibrio sp.]
MKIFLVLLVLTVVLISVYESKPFEDSSIIENKTTALVQHNISEKLALKKESQQPESINQIESELSNYTDKSFDDLSPEEIKRFNFLNLQRAIILKNQIFAKAKSKGYL